MRVVDPRRDRRKPERGLGQIADSLFGLAFCQALPRRFGGKISLPHDRLGGNGFQACGKRRPCCPDGGGFGPVMGNLERRDASVG